MRAPKPNALGCPEKAENPLPVVGRGVVVKFENAPPPPNAPVAGFMNGDWDAAVWLKADWPKPEAGCEGWPKADVG